MEARSYLAPQFWLLVFFKFTMNIGLWILNTRLGWEYGQTLMQNVCKLNMCLWIVCTEEFTLRFSVEWSPWCMRSTSTQNIGLLFYIILFYSTLQLAYKNKAFVYLTKRANYIRCIAHFDEITHCLFNRRPLLYHHEWVWNTWHMLIISVSNCMHDVLLYHDI